MANTVYTESVVTLNASSAEATMNALKNQADELGKKMREATKLGNAEDAARYQKELDQTRKAMNGIAKETKDYSDIMKKLNGSTLSELQKAYAGLNKQIKSLVPGTKEFVEKSKQLKDVKARMDEVNQSVRGTNKTLDQLKGLLPKLGIAAIFTAAAKAVVKFGKDTIQQTQLIGDRWERFTGGMSSAYSTFVKQLSSGEGWKNLLSNMAESYRLAAEVADILDEIFERQNSLSVQEARSRRLIEENNTIMRDGTKSAQERLDASEAVIAEEQKLATIRRDIAADDLSAREKDLADKVKMDKEELDWYVVRYNENREAILQAQEYNAEVAKIQGGLNAAYTNSAKGMNTTATITALNAQLAALNAGTSESVKHIAEMDRRYQRSDDERVTSYITALVRMEQADADFTASTSRAERTRNKMREQLSAEGAQNMLAAYNAEMAMVDAHQNEMTVAAKEAYASGEISEQEYQNRMISIQETALRGKMIVAERYKKSTVEYQSQLLDLTLQQQKELEAVLSASEKDVTAFFEDLVKDSEDEIASVMEEIDGEFQDQVDKLVELMGQAEDVKALLDPKTALGKEMQSELDSLDAMHEAKLLSEEEYEKAKKKLVKRYAAENLQLEMEQWSKAMEKVQSYFSQAGDAVTALQESESARLDAQMAAELTAAGDNAEEREKIEKKYEEKKLETQKKYAVADMVVNIAKTIAAGALAVMQAFAQLGPIAGGAMAAIIGTTTAAQVATIVAQKNSIMNASVNSSGSASSSAGAMSSRVATGYSSGGYTSAAANDYQEAGVVHANEWVAPASMVRANPIVFRRLEQARKSKKSVSGVGGFADGGMTSAVPQQGMTVSTLDADTVKRLTAVLDSIISHGIPAYVLLSDLNRAQELQSSIKTIVGK